MLNENNFNVKAYSPILLKAGGADVLFIKGLTNWSSNFLYRYLVPDTYKTVEDAIRDLIRELTANILKDEGYNIKAYDPFVKEYSYSCIENIVKGSDCLVILVEHSIIKKELQKNEEKIKKCMNHPTIIRFYQ